MSVNYIFKLSKPGYPVQDDVNKQNFIFRSDLVSMAQKSVTHPTVTTISVDVGGGFTEGQGNAIVPHEFGYTPKFMIFVTDSLGNYHHVPGGLTELDTTSKPEAYESFTVELDSRYVYLNVVAFDYEFIPQFGFSTKTARLNTYTFDMVLFMERVGLGIVIKTKVKSMTAQASIT